MCVSISAKLPPCAGEPAGRPADAPGMAKQRRQQHQQEQHQQEEGQGRQEGRGHTHTHTTQHARLPSARLGGCRFPMCPALQGYGDTVRPRFKSCSSQLLALNLTTHTYIPSTMGMEHCSTLQGCWKDCLDFSLPLTHTHTCKRWNHGTSPPGPKDIAVRCRNSHPHPMETM